MIRKWFDKLNIYFKCSVLSAIFLFILSLALIPVDIFTSCEYHFGALLGLGLGIIFHLLFGLYIEKYPNKHTWSIVLSIIRYSSFALLLIIISLCYYKWGIRIFNLFTFVGGYLFTLFLLIGMNFIKKE